jgi:hypothetical protein
MSQQIVALRASYAVVPMEVDSEGLQEVAAVPALPVVDLDNIAVPAAVKSAGRNAYKNFLYTELYSGRWRFKMPFTSALSWMATWLTRCVLSDYQRRKCQDGVWKVRFAVEYLLAWLVRLRNQHELVPFIVAMSLYAYACHVPTTFWKVLSVLRLLYCKPWTRKFAIHMASRLPGPRRPQSAGMYYEAADNDFVLLRIALQRVGTTHTNCDMIQRIRFGVHAPALDNFNWQSLRQGKLYRTVIVSSLQWEMDPVNMMGDTVLLQEWYARVARGERESFVCRGNVPCAKTWTQKLRPLLKFSASNSKHMDK